MADSDSADLPDGAILWVVGLDQWLSILATCWNYSGVFTNLTPRPHPSLVRSGEQTKALGLCAWLLVQLPRGDTAATPRTTGADGLCFLAPERPEFLNVWSRDPLLGNCMKCLLKGLSRLQGISVN